MADPKYLKPHDLDFCAAHVVEECGEVLAALGKTARWGWTSENPEIPKHQRETNCVWVRRELQDLKEAISRLESAIAEDFD